MPSTHFGTTFRKEARILGQKNEKSFDSLVRFITTNKQTNGIGYATQKSLYASDA